MKQGEETVMRDPRRARSIVRAGRLAAIAALLLVGTLSPREVAAVTVFSDGFESGTLGAWPVVQQVGGGSVIVQSSTVKTGTRAASLSALSKRGSVAFARAPLGETAMDVRASVAVRFASSDSRDVPFLRVLAAGDIPIVTLYRSPGASSVVIEHSGYRSTAAGSLPLGQWTTLEVRAVIAGSGSWTQVSNNGAVVYSSSSANLGSAPAAAIQIGSDEKNAGFSLAIDDVLVGRETPASDTTAPDTLINSGPSGTVAVTEASFTFSANEAGSTFACRLDGASFAACSSPKSYSGLVDGAHTFEVRATDAAGNTDASPASRTWTISSATTGDPVLVAAGDIAECNNPGDEATAALLDSISGTVATLGDNAYPNGTAAEFTNCYGPSWGRHKARTRPATGNHEYGTANAAGYFGYFGASAGDPTKGYYSYDLGSWHIIALNSTCAEVGGCGAGSAQEQWLRADLAANAASCTVAYFHHPRFSSGPHGSDTGMTAFWQALYDGGADVVLSSHDHLYERFGPQDPQGNADSAYGIQQFTVGTGGKSLYNVSTIKPNSQVRNSAAFGVLKLSLHADSYGWEFVPVAGQTFADSGTGTCHGAPVPTPTPTPTAGSFSDGFESGTFSAWSSVLTGTEGSATIQTSIVQTGARAARLSATSNTGSYAYARKSFPAAVTQMTAQGWFRVEQEGASGSNVPIYRMYDPNGARLVSVYRQNQSGGQIWVQHSGGYYSTTGAMPLQQWGKVQVRVVANGTGASTVEVRMNDVIIYSTTSASIGAAGMLTLQLGNDVKGQTFAIIADDIVVS